MASSSSDCLKCEHKDSLELFCETCSVVVCIKCALKKESPHKNHTKSLIEDCYDKHTKDLKDCLEQVNGKEKALKNVQESQARRESEIKERGKEVEAEINEMVEKITNGIRQSGAKLIESAKIVTDTRLQQSRPDKSVQDSLIQLKEVKDNVEQSLIGTRQQVLNSKKQMMERMQEVIGCINVEELQPKAQADVILSKNWELLKSIVAPNLGSILSHVQITNCDVVIDGDQVKWMPNNKLSLQLSVKAANEFLCIPPSSLTCSLAFNQLIDAEVTTTYPGVVYTLQFSPPIATPGTYTIKVDVCGIRLKDVAVAVPFNPYLINASKVRDIPANNPWGVAISDDNHVFVTNWHSNCIVVLDDERKEVKKEVNFSNPRGIALTKDNAILVLDNNGIHKVNLEGKRKIAKKINLNQPHGIAVSPKTGQVYVAETGSHCIKVLTPDLADLPVRSFGSNGTTDGCFNKPYDVAIDDEEFVYVTDSCNHRIQKFTADGKFVAQFGNKGDGLKHLDQPAGIAVSSEGLVYVTEKSNNRVSVFTSKGIFLHSYGQLKDEEKKDGNLQIPRGLTFDRNNFLYVCYSSQAGQAGQLVVYKNER